MHHDEKLFFAEATLQKLRNYIIYAVAVLMIAYCVFHFRENPVVISIVVTFLLFVVFITGNSQIVVCSDRIEFTISHPIKKISLRRILLFKDIQSVEADLRLSKKGFILTEVLSTFLPGFSIWNTLKFKLKDGTEKTIKTSVYKNEIVKALQTVKYSAKNQITITGI
jgi:hypothetical protein